jgi:hypothetical protein
MVTKELVKIYCEKFNLTYVEAPNGPLEDKEEWLDTVCAGFDGDPAFCATAIFLAGPSEGGVCKVITAFCDGDERLEDEFTEISTIALEVAILLGKPSHAV